MVNRQPVPVEKILRSTRVTLIVQAVLSIAAGVFMLALVSAFDISDRDGAGQLVLVGAVGIVLGIAVFGCGVLLLRRLPWVRVTVIAIEVVNGIGGLVTLVLAFAEDAAGQPGASVVPVIFSVLVLQSLLRADVRAWFAEGRTLAR